MKKRAVINLRELNIKGSIIDVTAKGNSIVNEIAMSALEEDMNALDKEFISWNKKYIPCEEGVYDYAIAFFSLNKIGNRFKIIRILKELKRVLKTNGKLLIWDACRTGIRPELSYDLRVLISEGDIRRVRYKVKFNPFRTGFNGLMKILKRQGFSISNSSVRDNIYHIEAVNTYERKQGNR